jgi:hypothetical protein
VFFSTVGRRFVVGGRRGEADEVDALGERRDAQLVVHFRRQVDDDQAIDAGIQRLVEETHRRRRYRSGCNSPSARSALHRRCLRKSRAICERLGKRLATGERTLAGQLDRRTIGHRVGKGHAELDDVGAGLGQRLHDLQASLHRSGSPAMK